ncbi:MAG: APC family permease [Bdellovibrionota bacterium]
MSIRPEDIPAPPEPEIGDQTAPPVEKVRRLIVGKPRDIAQKGIFEHISLIPFLAWVGLGADGLSSLSYGPQEAFATLGSHTYLAIALAAVMAGTVMLISLAYSRIIEEFPHGGGGYLVASKLLGPSAGVVSGAALVVDYILTVTVSIAAAGDALYSFLPAAWHDWKLTSEIFFIAGLTAVNIRGVRESVLALTPIFVLFLVTHLVLVAVALTTHAFEFPQVVSEVKGGFHTGLSALGWGGMLLLFAHAYSLGGGTYTGIEAVSNGVPLMREPRVKTANRTMIYMAGSLAFFAAGLLLCYLLLDVVPVEGKTMNASVLEKISEGWAWGGAFVVVALFSEAVLLIVAAQAGFLAGPQVLANMAIDSWVPHRFSAISERLTTMNGVLILSLASLGALLYTHGDVSHLVVMYSINVFLTFSLSMLGMLLLWWKRKKRVHRKRRLILFSLTLFLCLTILAITVYEKFGHGGWITLAVTGGFVALCFIIRRHYNQVYSKLGKLEETLRDIPLQHDTEPPPFDPKKPTAAVLVGSYSGLGIHTVLGIFRAFPKHFHNLVFMSIGVVDSGEMKGEEAIELIQERAKKTVEQYIAFAKGLGVPAVGRTSLGTDVVAEAEKICLDVAEECPRTTFFAGQLIFQRENWFHRFLHNETAFSIQKRLQWDGKTMVIMPVRVR